VPVNQVVINASPLILLFNSNLSFILADLFDEIVVPEAVWQEITSSATIDEASRVISQVDWLTRVTASPAEAVVQWDLGAGETEVLSFALTHPTFKPVLDDRAARKCARSLGLSTLSTGAILILAKEKKIIDSVEESLTMLRNYGMWISDSLIKLLKEQAGE
jgi:predicted nucleic acid-binding protein